METDITQDHTIFGLLATKNVPAIVEKIFFNLDYVSFLRCLRVNKAWSELISSDLYLKKGKSMFREDIFMDQKRLFHFSYKGNTDDIKNCLQSLFLDVNLQTPWGVAVIP